MELHSYITLGNNIEDMYDIFVRPVAQNDFTLVPHYKKFTWWHILLQDRARMVLETVKTASEPIVWCDADILFVRECSARILELLGDQDMLGSEDGIGGICCGIMVYAPTAKTIAFLEKVVNDEEAYARAICCDQEATNRFKDMVSWGFLPKDEFFSSAYIVGPSPVLGWRPTAECKIPANVRLIHAMSVHAPEKVEVLETFRKLLLKP